MFPRRSLPVQWGAPALASGQERQWIAPSGPPFQPQQQYGRNPQVLPCPTGYRVVSPGAPQGWGNTSLASAEGDSDVQFLGCKRPQPAGTSMRPPMGNRVQEEIREFMEVMQQHRHKMQAPYHPQGDQPISPRQNSAYIHDIKQRLLQYQNRQNSAVNPQHSPGLPPYQSNESAQRDPSQPRASSASPESPCVQGNFADSRFSFKVPILRKDQRSAYSSSRALRNSVSNIESPCVDSITSSQTIKTSPVTSPDPVCNMQNWSAPNAASVHPTRQDSSPYQQPLESTQLAHENNTPVTTLRTPQDNNTYFQNQAVGDPTVSSTIKSPVSNHPEESPTINEKAAVTENAVDARKARDPVPKANLFKPPRRMFSRKGKCLSGLFRKIPQGFPHVSFDYEVNCFLCNRMAAGNNVYEHMFFGNLKCIECGHVVRSCEDFKIVRHSSVECGTSKRKHRLASWADCPVEFLVYSVEQSLVSNRTEDCTSPTTSDVTAELGNYMKKLSLLRFYKPWKSAFRRCSEYVNSMNKPEDTQEAINGEEVASVIPGDTEEETNREEVNSVNLGDTQEEIKNEEVNSFISGDIEEEINQDEVDSVTLGTTQEEVNNVTLGATQEEIHMEDVFPGETRGEVNSEVNTDVRKDSHEEIRGQEISRSTGGSTFYDLISSQSERQEEPQVEGISINEALEQYQEHSQSLTDGTATIGVMQESRERTLNLQMFENELDDSDKDDHDNGTSEVSSEQFEDGGDNASTYTQEPEADTPQWGRDSDHTFASMVEEPGICQFSTSISENQAYEKSIELSKRLSTSSPEPEENQVVYYYPSEKAPEECPMCYYTLCATMFTLNTTNFRLSTECPDCSLKICIAYKDSATRSKKPKRFKSCL